jgi:hypothetical protein
MNIAICRIEPMPDDEMDKLRKAGNLQEKLT